MTIKEFINEDIKIVSQDEYIKELENKLQEEKGINKVIEKEKEKLEDKIYNAIYYIKLYMADEERQIYNISQIDVRELLNILRGSDK